MLRSLRTRLLTHYRRLEREGIVPVLRDDLRRGRLGLRRFLWRIAHDYSPNAIPVYVVGIQRSGTDMLVEAFERTPEAEIYNESRSSKAFFRFALRSDEVIASLVESSRHRCIVFKPLCDSHRVVHLMEGLGTPSRGRSIWIYREVEARVRSVLAHWPEGTRQVIRDIAEGRDVWEAGGLSQERLEFVRSIDHTRLTRPSEAALLWYLRNELFFDLGLDERDDVALVSYERFVTDPQRFMKLLVGLAGVSFRPSMVESVGRRPPPVSGTIEIDPAIRELCDDLQRRLDAEFERRLAVGVLTCPDSASTSV
jgi:hypothetical protein